MLVYLFKSTFCLVLLLGFYHLVLEKEKMHRFNRFYLLGSILFSLMVPSFTITIAPTIIETPVFTEASTLNQFPTNTIPQEAISETINYTQYIIGIYILVSLILCILLSRKVYSLLIKVKRNQQLNYFTATVVLLKERIVPYTFLHYIFINKYTYQTDTIDEQILTHELAHVEQKHSLDVLFIQVLQNLFWFNPIFSYYKKAIQLNHEFLADDAVINSHKNITEYQQVLLNTTAQNNNIYLASNLNYSLTKKRLLMMTKPSSNTKILLKKLLVAPLVAGFVFAFAQRVEAQEIITEQPKKFSKPEWQTLQNGENITITEDAPVVHAKEKVITGFKQINGVNYYFVTIGNTTKYYNKNGQLTTRKGKVISNRKAKASTIIPENYVTKTYFDGKVFCEFFDDKPNKNGENNIGIYIKAKLKEANNLNLKFQNGISEKEMNEYKTILKKVKSSKLVKETQSKWMLSTYNRMSPKQKKSVDNIHKYIPKGFFSKKPQAIEVIEKPIKKSLKQSYNNSTYKYLNKSYEKLRNEKPHFVKSSKQRQQNLNFLFSKLGSTYFKLSKADKRKVKRPILPHHPYMKLVKNGNNFYKLKNELTKEDKKLLPPPPPKPRIREVNPVKIEVIKNKKGLVEVLETPNWKTTKKKLQEVVELKEVEELTEVIELTETSELKEVKKMPEIVEVVDIISETKEAQVVVELQEKPISVKSIPVTKSRSETIEYLIKTGAKFTYNKKKISAKKALRLTTKNPRLPMYSVSKKGQPTKVYFSDTPYVKKTAKRPVIVELQEKPKSVKSVPVTKSRLETIKYLIKTGAKFTYNKKKISAKKALRLTTKNPRLPMYSVSKKGQPTKVYFSDTPYVKESKKN